VLDSCATTAGRIPDSTGLVCRQVAPDPRQFVAWSSPASDRDRVKLADWCAAVGPVLFQERAPAGAEPSVDRVGIVSWNTHVGGGDIDNLIATVRRGEFTNGRQLDQLVLLLQESYRSGDGVPAALVRHAEAPGRIVVGSHARHDRDIRRVAEAHEMAVLYAPSMRNGVAADDPEDRGNAILSTLPLSDPAVVELPFERQRRVVAIAFIGGQTRSGTPWRLRLVDVHLDTAVAVTRGGPFEARRRQATALLGTLTASPAPTVVAGDFNAWLGRREPAIDLLRREFPDAPPAGGPTWIGPAGMRATLDYVFARGEWQAMRVARLPSRFGSDHFPLLAVIDF